MKSSEWQVWIVDVEGSRDIPARTRRKTDRALHQAMRATRERFEERFRLSPQLLRGDEIQAVLRPGAPALTILTYLRARFAARTGRSPALRCGVGTGPIARLSPKGPFESEGEAFHRARRAVEWVRTRRAGRLTAWRSERDALDRAAEAVLALADTSFRRWTQAQWQAIAGRIEGKDLHRIARESRVSFQAVSSRLRAASWPEVQGALDYLHALARDMAPREGEESRARSHETHRSSARG